MGDRKNKSKSCLVLSSNPVLCYLSPESVVSVGKLSHAKWEKDKTVLITIAGLVYQSRPWCKT